VAAVYWTRDEATIINQFGLLDQFVSQIPLLNLSDILTVFLLHVK